MDSEKEQKESLDYAIARDKLIRQGVLPDDPIVKADDAYWEQFKQISRRKMGQGLVQNFSYHAFLGRFVDLVSRKQYGEEDKEPDWRGQNQGDDLVLMVELLACLHFFFLLIKKYPTTIFYFRLQSPY